MSFKLKLKNYDNDAIIYFNKVNELGGIFSVREKNIINDFIIDLKNNNLWNKINELCIFMGGIESATVKIKYNKLAGQIGTNINFNINDYSNNIGLTGNGINKSITTNMSFTNVGMNNRNFTIGYYSKSNHSKYPPLGSSFSGNFYISSSNTKGSIGLSQINSTTIPHATTDGLVSFSSDINGLYTYLNDNLYSSKPPTTAGSITGNLTIFKYASIFNDGSMSGYYAAQYLTQNEISILSKIFNNLHTLIGRRNNNRNLFFGDSITYGLGASTIGNRWSTILNKCIGGDEINVGIGSTNFQNTSITGTTYDQNGYTRFNASVLSQNTNKIFILYGINDIRESDVQYSAINFRTQMEEKIDLLINNGFNKNNIIIGTPPYINPLGYGAGGSTIKHLEWNDAIYNMTINKKVLFSDVYTYMLNNGGNSLISADNVHPNDNGHIAIKNCFLNTLSSLV